MREISTLGQTWRLPLVVLVSSRNSSPIIQPPCAILKIYIRYTDCSVSRSSTFLTPLKTPTRSQQCIIPKPSPEKNRNSIKYEKKEGKKKKKKKKCIKKTREKERVYKNKKISLCNH
ncbi:hypothetical protein M747DRAFT_159922 [Aspergillus niger ATCC 13496]|uniref:Uncharacterized protein n=1 Tax=Aspergillus niger ATCC 13496 TaxID=1353008 RepID=A0A370BN83_ASPNG|nr:hypothetical protein M747DRAFT_159922 [Aspergillus niger ATCC 13496]